MSLPNPFPQKNNTNKITDAGTTYPFVVLVLDESGSMDNKKQETILGVNKFIENLDKNTKVSLVKFNSGVYEVYFNIHKNEIKKFTNKNYNPLGYTALNDAIGYAIEKTNLFINEEQNKPSVSIVVITDGEENSSNKYSTAQLKKLVSKCEDCLWNFTFLGANIDSFSESSALGFSQTKVSNFSQDKTVDAFIAASNLSNRYHKTYSTMNSSGATRSVMSESLSSMSYTTDEIKKMGGE